MSQKLYVGGGGSGRDRASVLMHTFPSTNIDPNLPDMICVLLTEGTPLPSEFGPLLLIFMLNTPRD